MQWLLYWNDNRSVLTALGPALLATVTQFTLMQSTPLYCNPVNLKLLSCWHINLLFVTRLHMIRICFGTQWKLLCWAKACIPCLLHSKAFIWKSMEWKVLWPPLKWIVTNDIIQDMPMARIFICVYECDWFRDQKSKLNQLSINISINISWRSPKMNLLCLCTLQGDSWEFFHNLIPNDVIILLLVTAGITPDQTNSILSCI